ncbi:MAG TPA: hypothetical protein VJ032_13560 [Thermoanaerobaculia bacterium]|nr:hypothetical protein [Thermoanaerobaculia bacterium]
MKGRRLLATLFTISGATALVTEQAFEKILGTWIGTTTGAAAIVLAIYFAALSLGSFLYARIPPRFIKRPLRWYGFAELLLATWLLVIVVFFDRLPALVRPLLAAADSPLSLIAARVAVALLLMLVPITAAGMTFPAMVDASLQRSDAEPAAAMYTLNLAGAVIGAVLAPYALFPYAGVAGAVAIAAGLGGLAGLLAIAQTEGGLIVRPLSSANSPGSGRTISPPSETLLIAASAASGFLFFLLEVIWIHLIAIVIGNSVYAFAIGVGCVLAGLLLGSLATFRLNEADVGAVLVGGAIALALTTLRWPYIPHAFVTWGGNLESFAAGETLRWLQAAIVIVVPSALFGVAYPLLLRHAGNAQLAGRMNAANALASIGGALAANYILIPRVGAERSLIAIALAYAAIGTLLGKRKQLAFAVAALALFALLRPPWPILKLTSGEHVYFGTHVVKPTTRLLFAQEDADGGMTTVVQTPQDRELVTTIMTNGKFQGDDAMQRAAQRGFASVPAQFVQHRGNALVIGLGTGETVNVARQLGFKVDVAELAPAMVTGARRYFARVNGGALDAPGTRVIIEDGRNVLFRHDKRYDLVTIELTSVWFSGATNLYSADFYRLVDARLTDGGVVQQWIQLHHIGFAELASTIVTMRSVFPYVSFWSVGGQGVIVGSRHPQLVTDPRLVADRLLAPDDVTRLAREPFVINTDANRYLEYHTPRYALTLGDLAHRNTVALKRRACCS